MKPSVSPTRVAAKEARLQNVAWRSGDLGREKMHALCTQFFLET